MLHKALGLLRTTGAFPAHVWLEKWMADVPAGGAGERVVLLPEYAFYGVAMPPCGRIARHSLMNLAENSSFFWQSIEN